MKPISTVLFAGTVFSSLLVHVQDLQAATEQVLYSFCSQQNCADGGAPTGVIDVDNTLYGTTYIGGTGSGCRTSYGCGTVFSLDLTTGAEAVLHSFGGDADGTNPTAGLINIKDKLYGTTDSGGVLRRGDGVFRQPEKRPRDRVAFFWVLFRWSLSLCGTDQSQGHALWDHAKRRHSRQRHGVCDGPKNRRHNSALFVLQPAKLHGWRRSWPADRC
jgi:uncharacterized repeat protein (TIGR03803 family)